MTVSLRNWQGNPLQTLTTIYLFRNRDVYFATCPAMLEFLGVDQLADRKYYLAREKYLQSKQKETKTKSPDRDINDLFDEDKPGQQNEEILPTKLAPTGQISCKY